MTEHAHSSAAPAAVILAAGKGTRMKSELPKVAVPLSGKPMLLHVIEHLVEAGIRHIVVVVGYKKEVVRELVPSIEGVQIRFVEQKEQRGTADALMATESLLSSHHGPLLVACGDMPLIRAETFTHLLAQHRKEENRATVLGAYLENPTGYGRLVRDGSDRLNSIVEEKDATDEIRTIKETNTGTYVFDSPAIFTVLKGIDSQNAQNEYYLPDAISIFRSRGEHVGAHLLENPDEALGANSREDMEVLEAKYALQIA